MIEYQPLYHTLSRLKAEHWVSLLPEQIEQAFNLNSHGSATGWLEMLAELPDIQSSVRDLNSAKITIGDACSLDSAQRELFIQQLKTYHPWRKGPYCLYGIEIETEWRSDWKWDRLEPHISPLSNRLVLDVGCGNGYHCWRMLGAGARMVVGVEPLLLNVIQFRVIRKLYGEAPVYVLPITLEQIPAAVKVFDTVFSMGVLYHRRSPIDHLLALKECLRPGGELVLETLVIDGKLGETLVPEGRYAKMRNVWFLPSCDTLLGWMRRCGFKNCRLVDVNKTSIEEQRTTEWMQFHSLKDFLDQNDPSLTCEGLPAPTRAIILANAPDFSRLIQS